MAYADLPTMLRQVTRWILAAKQDQDPAVMLLHTNYAVGNLDLIRQLFTDEQVERETGYKPLTLHREAITLQDYAQKKLLELCPDVMLPKYLPPPLP